MDTLVHFHEIKQSIQRKIVFNKIFHLNLLRLIVLHVAVIMLQQKSHILKK